MVYCRYSEPSKQILSEVRFWALPTGSRIAYVHIPAKDSINAIPIVFLHGGPGAYQVTENLTEEPIKWFRHLAQLGFDIYFYDQIGSGLSARLSDPGKYTVDRHIADLEEIRNIIGKEQIILIGGSFGASLVANYMTVYPQHVSKAVFMCPGFMDPSEWTADRPAAPQMTPEFMNWVRENGSDNLIERCAKLDELMRTNLQAAYITAPDSEMDQLLDKFVDSIFPTVVYDKNLVKGNHSHGMGWWSYTMTNWDALHRNIHPGLILAGNETPVLVIRGDADYVPEAATRQYASTFLKTTYVRVERAGHYIWLDQPEQFRKSVESFLTSNNNWKSK